MHIHCSNPLYKPFCTGLFKKLLGYKKMTQKAAKLVSTIFSGQFTYLKTVSL